MGTDLARLSEMPPRLTRDLGCPGWGIFHTNAMIRAGSFCSKLSVIALFTRIHYFFCVLYSGEYDVCDVTLSVYPHRTSLKNMPSHGGNRTYDLWNTSPEYIVVNKIFSSDFDLKVIPQ
jgi:hypothetical protein